MSDQLRPGVREGSLGKKLLSRYSGLSAASRLFLWARWRWTPYEEMASLLPIKGRILDGGCGHGLLSLALATRSTARRVLGVDHSGQRVAAAQEAARGLKNVSFAAGDYSSPPRGPYDGIALIDVLHYLPYERQAQVMKNSVRRLRRRGVLLFREVDRKPGFASFFNRVHETFMTTFGFTRAQGLYFRSSDGWKELARQSGLKVKAMPCGRFPFADVLYRCERS